MTILHPQKPWTGNRKNLAMGTPLVILILGFLIYIVFFHLDPAEEDLLIPRILVSILTLAFASAGIYTIYRDAWLINLPFNYELFTKVIAGVESALSENKLIFFESESDIMSIMNNIVPGWQGPDRHAKTLAIQTDGPDLKLVIEFVNNKGQKKGTSNSRIMILNISSTNRKDAFTVKKTVTEMLMDLKYNSYPNQ